MSASPLRAHFAGLSNAALEALASRGLVRRALADVGAGKVEIKSEEPQAAEFLVDGETVHVSADGIRRSTCTCPAPGVCRHKLAAAIHLRDAAKARDTQSSAAPANWKEVFGAITPAEIARFAGKSGWEKALERAQASEAVSITDEGATLAVNFGAAEQPVVFLPTGGLKAAISKVPAATRKVAIAAAALAVRRSFELPEPEQREAPEPVASDEPNVQILATVKDFLERTYSTALAVAPIALEDEARRLSLGGRVEALPRLSGLLRRIATGLAALRRREADADSDAVLAAVAEAYAVCVALESAPAGPARANIAGQVRQEYSEAEEAELFGLGARLWETATGARGVTTHFYGAGSGQTYSVTLARPDGSDIAFNPAAAFRSTAIWGHPMVRLCAAQLKPPNLKASAAGRLSTSSSTQAETVQWSPARDIVLNWACVFDDWVRLEARLQSLFTPRLAVERRADVPVVLIFSRYATAQFDELTQSLTWPLADTAGRWIGLSLDYEGAERARIVALERAIATQRFWAVLALATEDDGRIDLHPYALWGSAQSLLDFSNESTGDLMSLLQRLRFGGRPRSGPQAVVAGGSASDVLLERAWRALLKRAEVGASVAVENFASEAGKLAAALEAAGLSAVARQFRRIAAGSGPAAGSAIRAAYAVFAARRARAQLAWMR